MFKKYCLPEFPTKIYYIQCLRCAARIEYAYLGSAYTTTSLIRADAVREIVVGRAKRVCAVITHPGAARARRDLEAHAAI